MRNKILRKQIALLVFTSGFAAMVCFADSDSKKNEAYLEISNDEKKEIQVYIQSGDGTTIGQASHQISFIVPAKQENQPGIVKRKITSQEMGGESTFSALGGTGTLETLVSIGNRCKGMRFGEKHKLVFKPTGTGGTVCEVKSSPLQSSTNEYETRKGDMDIKSGGGVEESDR